jgi:hypothetical protein
LVTKGKLNFFEMALAKVVLPLEGGPETIIKIGLVVITN